MKILKRALLFVLIFLSLNTFAQKELKDGYIVLESNDTIKGKLKDKKYFNKAGVRVFNDGRYIRYTKKVISEIHIGDTTYIKSDYDLWSKAFYKKEISGNVNLYTFRNRKMLSGFDSDIGYGRISEMLKFYCSDYPNIEDSLLVINKANIAEFISNYNKWKSENPDSKSFFEEKMHHKPRLSVKLGLLFPSVGGEVRLSKNICFNAKAESMIAANSFDGVHFPVFYKADIRYYYDLKKRENLNKKTYRFTGSYISIADYCFPKAEFNDVVLLYGLQRVTNKNWYFDFSIGAGMRTSSYKSFVLSYDFDLGFII